MDGWMGSSCDTNSIVVVVIMIHSACVLFMDYGWRILDWLLSSIETYH